MASRGSDPVTARLIRIRQRLLTGQTLSDIERRQLIQVVERRLATLPEHRPAARAAGETVHRNADEQEVAEQLARDRARAQEGNEGG